MIYLPDVLKYLIFSFWSGGEGDGDADNYSYAKSSSYSSDDGDAEGEGGHYTAADEGDEDY